LVGVVDVLDAAEAPVEDSASTGTRARLSRRVPRDWKELAPFTLVAFAVGFGLWLLRPELKAIPYPNDATVHASIARFAEQRIRAGHSPLDAWLPYFGLGTPEFSQYQVMSHVFTALLSIVLGDSTFRWSNYLLISTWPISVYLGARLLGLDRWQAAAAALVSPMMVNVTGYGFEWGSFIWLGSGMWSMLWGLWLLPIALGLAWRAVAHGERIALAAFVVGLVCALHFITGYLVLLSLGVFVLVRPSRFVKRFGRSALIGVGGLLIFSFVFVPTIAGLKYVNDNVFQRNTFWVNSYGPGKVFGWLYRGEVFDYGRAPIISILVLVGAVVCIARARRSEVARIPVGLMLLSLAMYSGRHVVGPVMDHLPGGTQILLHRYIMGVHFAGMLLAGIGSVWLAQSVFHAGRYVARFRFGRLAAAGLVVVLAVVALYPVLVDRKRYADSNRFFVNGQVAADNDYGKDALALIDYAKELGNGRIYAGSSSNWGAYTKVYQVPLYQLPAQQDADSLGFFLRTDSLSSNVETYFNDADPAQYDLFDVRYILLPNAQKPSVPATLLRTQGAFSLYEVNTSGYLEVVDTTEPIYADKTDMSLVMQPYISSPAVAQLRHPLVAYDGKPTQTPSTTSSAPYVGPPGSITWNDVSLQSGRFTAGVHADRDAWVMLKESYAPRWTATVDGQPVKTSMVAPSYVGVPVPAGDHVVVFTYRPYRWYPELLVFGFLVLLGLVFLPLVWRRYRRRRAPEAAEPPDPETEPVPATVGARPPAAEF
jgi:hypothetical protein